MPRRLDRHQRRRRDPPGAKDLGPGPHHRHDPRRLRHPLSEQAVQSGVPALEGSAGAEMARPIDRLANAATPARGAGLDRRGWPSASARPTCASSTAPGICRRLKRDPKAEFLRRRTSRAPSTSTSTRSPTPASPCRTCCRARTSSPRAVRKLGLGDGNRIVVYDGLRPLQRRARVVDVPRLRPRGRRGARRRLARNGRPKAGRSRPARRAARAPFHRAREQPAGARSRATIRRNIATQAASR